MNVGTILANHLACFGTLDDVARTALEGLRAEVRPLPRGKDMFTEGDQPDKVAVVLKGVLQRYSIAKNGKRQIHNFYLPSEAPCLETLYIDYLDNSLSAATDSQIGLIAHELIYDIIDRLPNVRRLIWRQTLAQAALFRQWLIRNSTFSAQASLANFLCEMFTRAKAAGIVTDNACSLPITQEQTGDALGLTSVHLNRTMQALRATGCCEWRGGKLEIIDWDRLVEEGDFDPRYLHLHC